jgi:hypothetical protein
MIASLGEEAEAINWYEQRISVERDASAKAIRQTAQQKEFKRFAVDLEFLVRRTPKWRTALSEVVFKKGDIVKHGGEAEKAKESS